MAISATNITRDYVVMGGTFDPVHNGHLKSAQQLAHVMGYAHIHMMPCGDAYHKQGTLPAKHRVAMLTQALAHQSVLQVDTTETIRDGATYTVDTLKQLRKAQGDAAHICWVLGADAANGLSQWQDWPSIFKLANLIVIHRAGEGVSENVTRVWPAQQHTQREIFKQQPHGCFMQLALEPVAVSSTNIRDALNQHKTVDGHVPQPVINYIERHGLYRGKN